MSRLPGKGPGRGGPASGLPASGASLRPPFAPGNMVRLTAGHRAPRVYGELAQQLGAGLAEGRAASERAAHEWGQLNGQGPPGDTTSDAADHDHDADHDQERRNL